MRRVFIIVGIVFFGCGAKDEVNKPFEESDFLPKSSRSYEDDVIDFANDTINYATPEDSILSLFQSVFQTSKRSNEHISQFPNRFDYRLNDVLTIENEIDSLKLYYWHFNDRNQTLSVFYNWLDCFGVSCLPIKIGSETQNMSTSAFSIWVSDVWLIYLVFEQPIVQKELSEKLLKLINQEEWLFEFYQQPNQKINWVKKELR
jgi:hypothetical protein